MSHSHTPSQVFSYFKNLGLNLGQIHYNLSTPEIVEQALHNHEGLLGSRGELIVSSGKFTGRSPKDKFIVDDNTSHEKIDWGKVNQPIQSEAFDYLLGQIGKFVETKSMYVFDGFAGADPKHRLKVRIATLKAWHHHFAKNMFIEAETPKQLEGFEPDFTIINACDYYETAKIKEMGLNSDVFTVFDLKRRIAIIGGTEYGGEMKKGIFSVLNYLLPDKGVMPMHASVNRDEEGNSAVFFGLSGTGKTTLSSDPSRVLIGDDEHGWTDEGVFNFEGGCYAKTIKLSAENEPDIWNAIRFGSVLENVDVNHLTREVDFDSDRFTENTRVSYPLSFIPNADLSGVANHPKAIIFLTADAFGVMPPVAKLTPGQASYHFLSGFTAKVAGTERGVTEPQPTFSSCFGAPFMLRTPKTYGDLLAAKMEKHQVPAYLVNTGWFGGAAGEVSRVSLSLTRKLIHAILDGSVEKGTLEGDPVFGFQVLVGLDDIPREKLDQSSAWKDKAAFEKARLNLARMFVENFEKLSDAKPLAQYGPKL